MVAITMAVGCKPNAPLTVDPALDVLEVEIGGEGFDLELAMDPEARFRGLSGRAEIADHTGMLFLFPAPRRMRFVMRDCLVPIDLVFLDPTGRIVAMHEMQVEPKGTPEGQLKTYGTPWPAQFAVELRGGTIRRLGLSLGRKIDLPIESLKRRAR